jgi:hypothetical protein
VFLLEIADWNNLRSAVRASTNAYIFYIQNKCQSRTCVVVDPQRGPGAGQTVVSHVFHATASGAPHYIDWFVVVA